ncbi:hypothetical protein KC19_3G231700 [Ceratodon purpureus]|uniref:Uncharacterized protein n=1 Tax=Ceratodon purpureus TaxID=3225 RepID=A0A8T0INH1_CERPU|nr:hypothetical protein KC19_3G231700 [Ceratodon purpureus]
MFVARRAAREDISPLGLEEFYPIQCIRFQQQASHKALPRDFRIPRTHKPGRHQPSPMKLIIAQQETLLHIQNLTCHLPQTTYVANSQFSDSSPVYEIQLPSFS